MVQTLIVRGLTDSSYSQNTVAAFLGKAEEITSLYEAIWNATASHMTTCDRSCPTCQTFILSDMTRHEGRDVFDAIQITRQVFKMPDTPEGSWFTSKVYWDTPAVTRAVESRGWDAVYDCAAGGLYSWDWERWMKSGLTSAFVMKPETLTE